ncbi:hypothetical protein ACMFMF_001917 [Clarireedia jacksonii]
MVLDAIYSYGTSRRPFLHQPTTTGAMRNGIYHLRTTADTTCPLALCFVLQSLDVGWWVGRSTSLFQPCVRSMEYEAFNGMYHTQYDTVGTAAHACRNYVMGGPALSTEK